MESPSPFQWEPIPFESSHWELILFEILTRMYRWRGSSFLVESAFLFQLDCNEDLLVFPVAIFASMISSRLGATPCPPATAAEGEARTRVGSPFFFGGSALFLRLVP